MTATSAAIIARLVLDMEECSTDRDTKVGCVITDTHGNILVTGANHHTRGMNVTDENTTRPEKYDWIEHAERNAIYAAAKMGVMLEGTVMHLPGYPCAECARAIAQSGIQALYHGSTYGWDVKKYKFDKAEKILKAAGVVLIERDVNKVATKKKHHFPDS